MSKKYTTEEMRNIVLKYRNLSTARHGKLIAANKINYLLTIKPVGDKTPKTSGYHRDDRVFKGNDDPLYKTYLEAWDSGDIDKFFKVYLMPVIYGAKIYVFKCMQKSLDYSVFTKSETQNLRDEQLEEIYQGLIDGVDVYKYLHHKIPADQMRITRKLLLEGNVFSCEDVCKIKVEENICNVPIKKVTDQMYKDIILEYISYSLNCLDSCSGWARYGTRSPENSPFCNDDKFGYIIKYFHQKDFSNELLCYIIDLLRRGNFVAIATMDIWLSKDITISEAEEMENKFTSRDDELIDAYY